jgi:two-component system nitrogen regulation response regulator GlnG
VISIHTPALRDRRGDIPLLINHFMSKASRELTTETKRCSPEVVASLQHYDWPGNVRELENLVKRLMVLSPSNSILLDDVPQEISQSQTCQSGWQDSLRVAVNQRLQAGESDLMGTIGSDFESTMIQAAMEHTKGHKQKAAELLGWGRNTLTRKLKQLGG